MNDEIFLSSNRLRFRRWNEKDFHLAKRLWGDTRVTEYIGGPFSEEQIRTRLLEEITHNKAYGVQYWPIFLLGNGAFIGCCGLRPYMPDEDIFEIGFHICSPYWGHGYATEAARTVIDYAFEKLQVKGLFAGHNPGNALSKNTLMKLGFQYIHDEYYRPTGLLHPSYLLLRENRWKENKLNT